jgi:hypothetical protein
VIGNEPEHAPDRAAEAAGGAARSGGEQMTTQYFFPEDVVVTTAPNGTRTARLGFEVAVSASSVSFTTLMSVAFAPSDLQAVVSAYQRAWLNAREAHRRNEREAFLSNVPGVQRERESWARFLAEGNERSISAWRIWERGALP